MNSLDNEKLSLIDGGSTTVTGTLVSALTSGIKAIFDVGRSLGSSACTLP